MNVLVLNPSEGGLDYALIADRERTFGGTVGPERYDAENPSGHLRHIAEKRCLAKGGRPGLIAVRAVFGGTRFRSPARVTPEVLETLRALAPAAPIHAPRLETLLRACDRVWPDVPLMLVFETSFFVDLPRREQRYAVEPSTVEALGARRYGFHGIYHEAAWAHIQGRLKKMGKRCVSRVLSVCLEPKPEATAIAGGRPLMVTGGATPLDGLPGETTCGEIDPALALIIARRMGWGPEQVNDLLTRHSGLRGLTGRALTFDRLFENSRAEDQLAREVFRYRLLLATGAAIAAVGRLDGVVFSGRYATVAKYLAPWLAERIEFLHRAGFSEPVFEVFTRPIEELVAEAAVAAWRAEETHRSLHAGRRLVFGG